MLYTQNERLIAIGTPLGKDVLLLAGFRGHEEISRLFHFKLDLLSENHNIIFEDIVGKNVTLSMHLSNGDTRYFNGLISNFSQGRSDRETDTASVLSSYNATMVPWLWLLTQTTDSRIFQHLSVPDIVEKIFTEKGFSDYKFLLHENYDPREYCVQYQETDFNFVSRLMEHEGICYFFEHENGKHTLIISDTPGQHKPCPHQGEATYHSCVGGLLLEEDVITDLGKKKQITPNKYALNDYCFVTPGMNLHVEADSNDALYPTELEIYDCQGCYEKRNIGDHVSNLRMQEHETTITTLTGTSICRSFSTGYRIDIKGHCLEDIADKPFLLTSIDHDASEVESYRSLSQKSGTPGFSYTNEFTCIPFSVTFRPARITPKPVMKGAQTAIVTGPAGEEIYTDEHGRVKVQFHWDREGKRDENSSCWIRIGQIWAGLGWGSVFIPRMGHEVIVDFLEGDPDQPIIIGSVYHGTNKPPYTLPDQKTKSLIKSNSSKGGQGFNEIRFEDKKGEEQVFIHAEKNQDIRVKNDCFEWIGNNRHLIVKNDQKEHVENNRQEKVGADHIEEIGKDRHLKVSGKEAKSIGGSKSLTVTGDVIEVFKANHSEQVTDDYYVKAKNIVIEAMSNVTIKVGQSYIAIESGGIKIGTTGQIILEANSTIGIKGTAGVTIESTTRATLKAPITTVSADALTTIQGALVKIN